MKRLIVCALFASFFVGGVAFAGKKKEEIVWVHMNWAAREGSAKGCVQTNATDSEMDEDKKLTERLLVAAQTACADSERKDPGSCPRGEATASAGGFGQGSCP